MVDKDFAAMSSAPNVDIEMIPIEAQRRYPEVLLVEDSKFLEDILATFFRLDGFSARPAYGGEHAMQEIERKVPDIAFIDLVMPEVDGIQVARLVRSSGLATRPLLVTFSGWEEYEMRPKALDAGFDYFLASTTGDSGYQTLHDRPCRRRLSWVTSSSITDLVANPA